MKTKGYSEYVAARDRNRPAVVVNLQDYRDWLYGKLSNLALLGQAAPSEFLKALSRERVVREASRAGLGCNVRVLAAFESQNLERFVEALDVLQGTARFAALQQAFFDAFDPHVVEPSDVDRLSEEACWIVHERALVAGSKLATELAAKASRPQEIKVRPELGDWVPSAFEFEDGAFGTQIVCGINEGAETQEAVRPRHVKVFVSVPQEQRRIMEAKARDIALGIRAHIDAGTVLSKEIPERDGSDTWAVRLECSGLADLGDTLFAEASIPIKSMKRLIG